MTDQKKLQTSKAGAVELEEGALDNAAGGASDYLLELEGVKGESKAKQAGIIAVKPARGL